MKLWFLILIFIVAGGLFLWVAWDQYRVAHQTLGDYTLGVMRYCGKDTAHIDSAWFEGYKEVEDSFFAAGVIAGTGLGLMFGSIIFGAFTLEKIKEKEAGSG